MDNETKYKRPTFDKLIEERAIESSREFIYDWARYQFDLMQQEITQEKLEKITKEIMENPKYNDDVFEVLNAYIQDVWEEIEDQEKTQALADYINTLDLPVQAETTEDGYTRIRLTDVNQDFSFEVKTSDGIYDYWQNFDIETEVLNFLEAKRNGLSGVPYVTDLVKEEEKIDKTLEQLATKCNLWKDKVKGDLKNE